MGNLRPKANIHQGDYELWVHLPDGTWEKNNSFPTRGARSIRPLSDDKQKMYLRELFLAGGIHNGKGVKSRSYNPHSITHAAILPAGSTSFKQAEEVWDGEHWIINPGPGMLRDPQKITRSKTSGFTAWICHTPEVQAQRKKSGLPANITLLPAANEDWKAWLERFLDGGSEEYTPFVCKEAGELPTLYLQLRFLKWRCWRYVTQHSGSVTGVHFYLDGEKKASLDLQTGLLFDVQHPGKSLQPTFFQKLVPDYCL